MRFYVHGAGRGGRESWPAQHDADAVFADHSSRSLMLGKADIVGQQCPDGDVVLVAHSLGAVPAAMAYAAGDISPSHVVLLEPALYDVARGDDAIERHIGAVTEARQRAAEGDLFGYWQIVGPLMFRREAIRDRWHEDKDVARRLADLEPPWGHDIDATAFAKVPMLVVTGGWNDEYEAIAESLAPSGAERVELRGKNHRPQDHPEFESALAEFLGSRTWPERTLSGTFAEDRA